ncbi:hypothetical protein H0H92_001781 [Tricholoma furcatifolium]|nr:hypothetical protein H0H92_001781 [Tricholoma furcatifolium]
MAFDSNPNGPAVLSVIKAVEDYMWSPPSLIRLSHASLVFPSYGVSTLSPAQEIGEYLGDIFLADFIHLILRRRRSPMSENVGFLKRARPILCSNAVLSVLMKEGDLGYPGVDISNVRTKKLGDLFELLVNETRITYPYQECLADIRDSFSLLVGVLENEFLKVCAALTPVLAFIMLMVNSSAKHSSDEDSSSSSNSRRKRFRKDIDEPNENQPPSKVIRKPKKKNRRRRRKSQAQRQTLSKHEVDSSESGTLRRDQTRLTKGTKSLSSTTTGLVAAGTIFSSRSGSSTSRAFAQKRSVNRKDEVLSHATGVTIRSASSHSHPASDRCVDNGDMTIPSSASFLRKRQVWSGEPQHSLLKNELGTQPLSELAFTVGKASNCSPKISHTANEGTRVYTLPAETSNGQTAPTATVRRPRSASEVDAVLRDVLASLAQTAKERARHLSFYSAAGLSTDPISLSLVSLSAP